MNMPSFLETQKRVSVFETTLCIQQNTLSVFNIIIQTSTSTVSLIRYPFDLLEFHQKIQFYYPRVKVTFPSLTNPSKRPKKQEQQHSLRNLKRRSFRNLLPFSRKKTNADKVEKYLERCFQHPIVSISSILRDFISVQRDEDALMTSQHTSATLTPTVYTTTKNSDKKDDSTPASACASLPPSSPSSSVSPSPNNNAIIDTVREPLAPEPISSPVPTATVSNTDSAIIHMSPPSPISLEDLELFKILGKGCMGKVLLVRSRRGGQMYALKSIKKKWVIKQKELIHTKAERDILVRLRNQPFLANLYHVFQTPSELFLVLNYYAGGDIATQLSLVSSFSEERTRFYAAEIVYGLGILHENGIVYRDLKPENVLIGRDGHIVLTDFGLSKIFTEQDYDEDNVPCTQTFCGTAEYLAPEVLLGEPYTFAVDFWSLGTLLYEMLAGTTPFWADSHMDMYRRVLEDPLKFPSYFDPTTCNFLSGLLEKEAYERLGWGEHGIEEIKLHPYFDFVENWNNVSQYKLHPPYIPTVSSEDDPSNFDEMFTSMPVRISQSSAIGVQDIVDVPGSIPGEDPFKGFCFDHTTDNYTNSAEKQSLHSNVIQPSYHDNSSSQDIVRIRKRHSAALSFTQPLSATDASLQEDSHVIKRRQTVDLSCASSRIATPQSPALSSFGDIMYPKVDEETSSVYSASSLSFSLDAQETTTATQAGSTASFDIENQCIVLQQPSPYERPHCPVPGQMRSHSSNLDQSPSLPHSNASTINNSICSYLTLDTVLPESIAATQESVYH